MTVAAPSDPMEGSLLQLAPDELHDALEKHEAISHFNLQETEQETAEAEAPSVQSDVQAVRQSDRLQSRGAGAVLRSRTPRTSSSVDVQEEGNGHPSFDASEEGGEKELRRLSVRTTGAHRSPELPAGLVSPRAGFTSTAILALPAPYRPLGLTAKRARPQQRGRFAKVGKGGLARQLSVGVSEVFTEGEGSGRSGTNSGNNVLRECSVCHLHKSPRWRTGPEGPKTLCNRCGVYWSQNRHKWDELVDRFKATSDGEVNQLQAEFKAVRYGKNADLEQKRAKGGASKPPIQGVTNPPKIRKASIPGGHSRSDTETILRKLQELPGHFAKSLRKELLGFGLVRKPSPKPEEGEGQARQQVEAEEEVVISSGSDDEALDERVRNRAMAGPSGTAHGSLLQGCGSSNNLDASMVLEAGALPAHPASSSGFQGLAHPGENKAKRKRSETKIVRDTLTQTGAKKARLVSGETAEVAHIEAPLPSGQRKEEDVIKDAEELLRKGGLTGAPQRAGHFVGGRKSGVKRTVKITERRSLQHPARPSNPVGIVINSAGLAKIRIGGFPQVIPKEEAAAQLGEQGLPVLVKKKPGRPPGTVRLAASAKPLSDPAGKTQLAVTIPTPRNGDGSLPEGMTPTIRSARIKARGPAPDFTDDFEDEDDALEEAPVKKRRGRPPSAAKVGSLAHLTDTTEGGLKYKGAKRGRKPRRDGEGPRKRGRPAGGFSSKLDEFERVFKPSVRRTKRPRMGIKEPRFSVDFGSPSGEFPHIPDSLLVPPFPPVPELLLPSRLQKNRSRSPAPGSPSKPRVPLQVGDITVESFGSVDPQHVTVESGRICAIGYRSTWKDPTLGLVHVSEVVAGEDGRPVYSVTCRLKERTNDEETSPSPQATLGRSNSLQVQQSSGLPVQRSFSLGREDARFRASAPSPLGQSQHNSFREDKKASSLEPREHEEAQAPAEGHVLEGAQGAAQEWDEGQLADRTLSPEQLPLGGSKALVSLRKEPTISPLLVGKPGPPIEGLKGLDEGADLHDLDTAMIWDEDFHVPFGDVEMPQVSPEVGAFSSPFGDGQKQEGQELGWGFGMGNEQDRAWGASGPVSEQEAEESMLAVFRGPGEGTKPEAHAEEAVGLQEVSAEGLQCGSLVQPAEGTGSAMVPAADTPEVATPPVLSPSSPPSSLLRIKTSLPLGPKADAGTSDTLPEEAESLKAISVTLPPPLERKTSGGVPQPRRPGRPKRLDPKRLPAVVLPDRQLRSERQSVETPRTAHRKLTGSDLLVKRSSPEEAWKAYAASWRETFKARAPQHVEEIDWQDFERDHFGLEKPEVVQWIANLFQASPRLTQARESFQNLQLVQHSGPVQPTAKTDAERLATRAEEKEASDEAARLKRQLADGMRRQLVLFNAHPEGQTKEEAKVQPLVIKGVSVVELQEVLQIHDQLSSVPSLDVPPHDIFLSGLIYPTPSTESLINPDGISLGKPKPRPKSHSSKAPTAVKPLRPVDASEAVAALHLQLVRMAAAKMSEQTHRAPKLMLPQQEVSPGPARETTPNTDGEVNETAVPAGLPPQTPRLEELSPTGLSESGEKVPARVSTRAPKWKAGLTNGEAPWALLMSRNMAKMNGSGQEMEKEAGAQHEGPPFRQGLELLDIVTWPAFVRRVLEQEPVQTKPANEEEQPPPEESPAEPAPVATEIKVEQAGEAGPLDEEKHDEEDSVPLPIILTPIAVVRRVEKEAQVLADAERQLAKALAQLKGHERPAMETTDAAQKTGSKPEPPVDLASKEEVVPGPDKPTEDYAFWWSPLEGLGPVNTNQGSKIRGRIQAALAMRPPEWARSELGKAIGRDVYRSSAGGPMKKVALSVLDRALQIQAESEKPSLAKYATTKSCREVIRLVAEQDDVKIFSNLSGGSEDRFSLEGFQTRSEPFRVGGKGFRVLAGERRGLKRAHEDTLSEEIPCGYVRRLDLRTIDMRLAGRAYGSSLELFLADVQLVWENARQQFPQESREVRTAHELSELFNRLYQEKVLNVGPDGLPLSKPSSRPPKDLTIRISDPVWGRLPKAPWEWEGCKVCGIDENDAQVLLCDHCSEEYHTYCLKPPLLRIPEGDWLCHNCRNLPATPLRSPTVGRPGRKKGSGKGRRDGRKVKPRPRDASEPSERKRPGRPLSAKGAERRAAEERKRVSREMAVSGPTRMERLDGVLALEAPESPASRLTHSAEEAQTGPPEGRGGEASVEEVKFLGEPQAEAPVADEVKPLTRSAVTEGAKRVGEMEEAHKDEQAPAEVTPVVKIEVPGEDSRTLRSKAAVPSEGKEPVKRKGQNQYTKRKELAELAARSAVEKEEGKTPTEEKPRKRQNQYTKRKELAFAAGKSKTGSPPKTPKSSPGLKLKMKAGSVVKKSPASKLASALKAAKDKQAKKGQIKKEAVKQGGEVKRKGENQYTKAKRLAEEAAKEARRAARRAWRQAKKKRLAEEAKLAAEGKSVGEQKRKGENQYTKAKKLAEEAAAKERKPGENQYTKAKKLADAVKKPSVTVSHKKKKAASGDGTEVKRRHENQYTKAKRLAEEKAKEEAGDVKRRGENQYTKAKRLAEEAAKEGAARAKPKGENQYTKAKKLATLLALEEGRPEVQAAENVKPQIYLAGRKEEQPRRKRENQYTKRKRLLEQGIEMKPATVEPRSGLRSQPQEAGREDKQETPLERADSVVYYTRRKMEPEEMKQVKSEPETEQSPADLKGQDARKQPANSSTGDGSAAGQVRSANTPGSSQEGGVDIREQEVKTGLLSGKSGEVLPVQPVVELGSGIPSESKTAESSGPHALDVEHGAAASALGVPAGKEVADVEFADVRPAEDVMAGQLGTGNVLPSVHAEVSKQSAEVSEGRRAKRPRLTKEGESTRRASQQGERKERRPYQSRGPIVKAPEIVEEVKEKSPEQLLAARMGECAYWDLSLSERIHVLKALAQRATDCVALADAPERPSHLGTDADGVQYWAVSSGSLGPLLLAGKPSPSAEVSELGLGSETGPKEGPATSLEAPTHVTPEGQVDCGTLHQATKVPEAGESKEPAVVSGLTPGATVAGVLGPQPEEVSNVQKAEDEDLRDAVLKAELPVKETAEQPSKGDAETAGPKEVDERAAEGERPSKGEDAEDLSRDGGSEPSLLKGTWQVAASEEELAKIAERLMGGDVKLVESLRAWEDRLRQGLDALSGQGKRPREEGEGDFTQRKKQKVAHEEHTLRATELLAERERTAGDSCESRSLSRCVCGEPLVLPRVHCPFCHCSAEKGKTHAFSHWCDRPHGCLLLEESKGSPPSGPFEVPAGADALEESQADLEVLAGLEMDLQAVFAEGLDYHGLGGVASAPFTSLARSPPQRVALNRRELPPAVVPLQEAGFEAPSKESLLHSQSLPLAEPSNPLGATVSLPADTSAIVPFESPPLASPEHKHAASTGWLIEGQQAALTRLKMDLLDLETALSAHCLGGVRSTPERCNAWRVLVKSASNPEELALAAVLLELMIKPASILKEWASMGPLSRAVAEGNGKTIAQVALLIHSLDGVIDFEGLHAVKESSKKRRVR